MRSRSRPIVIVTLLGLGLGAMLLLPGQPNPKIAAAEEPVHLAGPGTPNPELLRQLDKSLRPPAPDEVQAAVLEEPDVNPPLMPTLAKFEEPAAAEPASPVEPTDRIGPTAVNLRGGPSSSSDRLSVLTPGEPVAVGQTVNGWVEVTLADGSTGWIYGRFLASAAPTEVAPQQVAARSVEARAVVSGASDDALENRGALIASRLSAKARPLDSSPSIFMLKPGTRVRIAEVRGDWMRVETPDGISGWIRRAD